MDKYNVIDITTDLDALNQDMYKWSSMPYERRLRSDDECRRRYGVSNITLYNRLVSILKEYNQSFQKKNNYKSLIFHFQ